MIYTRTVWSDLEQSEWHKQQSRYTLEQSDLYFILQQPDYLCVNQIYITSVNICSSTYLFYCFYVTFNIINIVNYAYSHSYTYKYRMPLYLIKT